MEGGTLVGDGGVAHPRGAVPALALATRGPRGHRQALLT